MGPFIVGLRCFSLLLIFLFSISYTTIQVKRAEELGASGILIYSDPRDDGYVTASNGFTPYPQGPARNPTSIQRGSVMYLSTYPGDPTTPGRPAYPDVSRDESLSVPKIPSLPISWSNAERILSEIGDFHNITSGKLTGSVSSKKVHLVNRVNKSITPIWNTMAAIPGHVKNEIILVGCHRDAWVLGAADPVSGTASLGEIVKGFGELLRQGWKPMRTVIFASWDAEEQGLIGSTEYGEDFQEFLGENVVAYINVDVSSSGSSWYVGASPSLAALVRDVAKTVSHPTESGKTLWDARRDEGPFRPDLNFTSELVVDPVVLQAYESTKQELVKQEEQGG